VWRGPITAFSLVVSLLVLPGASAAGSAAHEDTVGWRGDFETGDLSQWRPVQAKERTRIAIESEIVRQGHYGVRVEVRPGDSNVAGSGSGERADLWIGSSTTAAAEGHEQYWAWSTYFPANFDAPRGSFNAFVGFHHTGTTGQSNLHFAVTDMRALTLRVLGGNFNRPVRKDFVLARLTKGRWYDFVVHVRWSSDRSGLVEVWVNNQKVVGRTLVPTLYVGQGAYLKMGFYRAPYSKPTVDYHDDMRRGQTLAEVAHWLQAFPPE
jgi:hypothetical protein